MYGLIQTLILRPLFLSRRQRGTAGQGRVALQYGRRRRAVDHTEPQRLALDAELRGTRVLAGHLEGDLAGVGDQHAVAATRQVERDVLVRLLAGGARIGVPDIDHLAVLDERCEAFTEAV